MQTTGVIRVHMTIDSACDTESNELTSLRDDALADNPAYNNFSMYSLW